MALPIGMICRAWITVEGEKVFAKDHGKRAFCFFPKPKEGQEMPIAQTKKDPSDKK